MVAGERSKQRECMPLARLERALVTAGVVTLFSCSGLGAVAQGTVADSQVEANVLKALASAPDLAISAIRTNTQSGVVTITGSVPDEEARRKAEDIVANTAGVRKVVDKLQLGEANASAASGASGEQPAGMVLQSDGTYAPAPSNDGQTVASAPAPAQGAAAPLAAQRNQPDADQALEQQRDQQTNPQFNGAAPGAQPSDPAANTTSPAPNTRQVPYGYPQQPQSYPPQQPQGYPPQQTQNYPQQPQGYPPQPGSSPRPYGCPQQPPYCDASPYRAGAQPTVWGGQQPGEPVLVPAGAMVRVRVNRSLTSNHTQPGTTFDGIVLNDVTADGFVAIPRGASVEGTVLDAQASGALRGRGELSLQLTRLTVGGRTYPIVSDVWAHNGGDKTIETINKTAGIGALGAVFGALAGGGVGAAVGGGVGAAAGVASSAASPNGQIVIPAEGVVLFHLDQPVTVQTVSEQEMQRLAYGVGSNAGPAGLQRRYYPGYYPYPYAYGVYGPGPYGYPVPPVPPPPPPQ